METQSSVVAEADKKKEVVLKLRLVGVGGAPQIRRVRLPRIHVEGQVSYAALVDVATSFSYTSTAADVPSNPTDYDCVLTYYDIDNDCVTIASTEELMDAIDQFSSLENPVLRITTDVKIKEGRPFTPTTPESDKTDTDGKESMHMHTHTTKTSSPMPMPINGRVNHLQNIVESCVNSSNAAASEDAAMLAKEVVGNIEMNKNEPKEEETDKTGVEENKPEERPFVHGRHTCDGCLCTPIIGTRYHSTNLPDYDLCAKCRGNYMGTEIQFDAAELDRDLPFQERWHMPMPINGRVNHLQNIVESCVSVLAAAVVTVVKRAFVRVFRVFRPVLVSDQQTLLRHLGLQFNSIQI